MTLNLYVLTPNRINWDSEVKEIILSTNSGQIGMLRNRAPIATVVDIGLLRIRLNDQWLPVALMGGFARISNNEITILGNDAEMSTDTDPQEAQQALEIAKANLSRAQGKRQAIEANLALRSRRILYMEIRGQGTIPLTRTNENLTPREIEQKAAKLAYSLYVPIEVL